ncbi:MAG: 6,7-dimethyl-8-ribityllumazine synthase [Gammaproteobacteria bacterium]|nr:6,7-dimethyl-8-ribityllumazine synthase [Gammaproteobacteria bacterium]
MKTIDGTPSVSEQGGDRRIAIVASRFNQFIVDQLVAGAEDALDRHQVTASDRVLVWVPGAYELPLAADRLASTRRFDAVIALGAVIRGGTPHFDFVAGECASGLTRVALDHGLPVAFGVLTTDTIEQALERAGTGEGNKGFDAAMTALDMLAVVREVDALADVPGGQ